MIEIRNVSKTYGKAKLAVDNLSLTIEPGHIYGFLGPNGAGKTTTIKMITGILEPDEGTIIINGYDISKEDIKAKQCFGFVPDDPNAFLKLSGLEYLSFMADIYGVSHEDRVERIENLSKRLGINNVLIDKILSYSHGMRQKIMVIGSLIHDPDIWILDEPLTGLDPKSAREIKEMMKEHAQKGKSVFFSTHVLEVAETICDKITVISKSKIIFSGDLADMKKQKDQTLESIFLEMTENE